MSDGVTRIAVTASVRTGPVHGGASGMLYGLSDPGIPSDALVAGARPRTIAQKAPAGRQHPTGDAVEVADRFFANGGEEILVYMQDVYEQWPYEQLGMADYLEKIREMVALVATGPDADRFSWVPFNEPDWIWYGDWQADRDRFFSDWEAAVTEIRRILPEARIVGMNDMAWSLERMRDFLPWAAERGLLPTTIAWHELRPESLATYRDHYREYRELEFSLGIAPIPININEYGNRRDFSNPAQLVKWLAMFEDTKVDADMAFWTFAGNLSNNAVQSAQANAGWWLLAWYADLTGETIRATAGGDVAVIAALDESRAQVTVLVGGAAGAPAEVTVTGVPESFGADLDVSLTELAWSGHEGDAPVPRVVTRLRLPAAADRTLGFLIPAAEASSAWRAVVTPAEADATTLRAPRRSSWEAEHAAIEGAAVTVRDDDPQTSWTSGGKDVVWPEEGEASVTFEVEAHDDGDHTLAIFYGTDSVREQLELHLDGRLDRLVEFPATLNQTFRGRVDLPVALGRGSHEITLRGAAGSIAVDRMDLVFDAAPDVVELDARAARLSGSARLDPGSASTKPRVVLAPEGASCWFISAVEDGYYELSLEVAGVGILSAQVAGRPVIPAHDLPAADASGGGGRRLSVIVHLARGITEVRITARDGTVELALLRLVRSPEHDAASIVFAATTAQLEGGTRLEVHDPVSGDSHIGGLVGGAVAFTSPVAFAPGEYDLAVWYGNPAKNGSHEYNTDVVSATARIDVDGAAAREVLLRHTYAADNFWSVVVPVTVVTGGRGIRLSGGLIAPTIERLVLSPLVVGDTSDRISQIHQTNR